jgi:error-prone DNA polymerase
MGFYAPAQIVGDARANKVDVREIDVMHSDWDTKLEPGDGEPAVRLGLRQIDGFREDWATEIMKARGMLRADAAAAPGIEAIARAARLPARALRMLADADAFRSFGHDRRQALWEVRRTPTDALPLFAAADARELGEEEDPQLPAMPLSEHVAADYQTTRLSLKAHPMSFLRGLFSGEGVLSSEQVRQAKDGTRARVAGVVLVRQRPGEGKAIFITLEDETGVTNVLLWARDFEKYRRQVMAARLMEVRGIIQHSDEGVVHLMGAHVVDRTAELERLSEDHPTRLQLSRADVFEHPQAPRHHVPRGSHPRNVRILPPSRDFH